MSKQVKLLEDLNSSVLSIGSDSFGLSSSSTNTAKENPQNGGGFFFTDDMAQLAIEACKKGEFPVVLFLVNEDKITDFCEQDDETGYTILHYLVAYYNMINSIDTRMSSIIDKIIKRPDVHKFINKQDKIHKNSPLHLAVMSKNTELANKLISAGANPKLKNSNNLHIVTDSESDVLGEVSRQAIMSEVKDSPKDLFIKSVSPKSSDVDNNIKNMVDALFNMENRKKLSPTMSENLPDTLRLTDVRRNNMSDNFSEVTNTEHFLDEMIKHYDNPQLGGKINGTRKMNSSSLHEGAVSISDMYEESEHVLSEMSELSRMIGNQADETHKRVISRIRELLGVDDITARAYKAVLYAKVKTDKPELNNYDRAVEMEKITTEEVLKGLNKSKVEEIKEYITNKDKERASQPPRDKKEKSGDKPKKEKKVMSDTSDMSDTSSEEEPKKKPVKKTKAKKTSEAGLSATSDNILSSDSMFSETSLDQ
jgi:hypothetical protein